MRASTGARLSENEALDVARELAALGTRESR